MTVQELIDRLDTLPDWAKRRVVNIAWNLSWSPKHPDLHDIAVDTSVSAQEVLFDDGDVFIVMRKVYEDA